MGNPHLIAEFHRTGYFSSQNNPKYLELSYKMDLDFWDGFEWETPIL